MTSPAFPSPPTDGRLTAERATRRTDSRIAAVVRVACGNLVEMFDFFLFGLYATSIAKTFFPASSEYASLLLTFATFGAGFLMRPVGAIVLGAYTDRVGRRAGLLLSLGLMGIGSLLLAITPGYSAIGVAAPVIVLIGRLLQGLSAGAEVGGVSIYLAEIAPPGRKGFYVAWQSASQQLAIILAAALGYAVNTHFAKGQVDTWAWRLPFVAGCLILPLLLYLRSGLGETPSFQSSSYRPAMREVLTSIARNWEVILLGSLMVVMTTVAFYLITVYTPTYGKAVLRLTASDALLVTACVGLSNFVWLPLSGALSDRVGCTPIMMVSTLLAAITAYPALAWLVAAPSFDRMLAVDLWLSALYAAYNGAALPAIAQGVPANVRAVGFSLAYSLATAVAGGFTPMIATWLIDRTGDKAAPGWWLVAAALCGLVSTLAFRRRTARVSGQVA